MPLSLVWKKTFAAAALMGGILATRANGAFTTIEKTPTPQPVTREILSTLYGGRFFGSGGNFSNGFIRAERVSDSGGGPIALKSISGQQSDELWAGGQYDVSAVAKFSATPHTVGFYDRSTFTPLFNAGGVGFAATGAARRVDMRHMTFAWGVATDRDVAASEQSLNGGEADHVVTYRIKGLPWTQWLLFWQDAESKDAAIQADSPRDFNDLVMQVRAAGILSSPGGVGRPIGGGIISPPRVPSDPSSPVTVPLPPAAWSGAATLAAMLFARRRVTAVR